MMARVIATTAIFLRGNHVLAQIRPDPRGWKHDKFDAMDINNDEKISHEE